MDTQAFPNVRKKVTRSFPEFFDWLKNTMNFYPQVCIDVGAAKGTPSIYNAFKDAKHYAFEPFGEHIPQLQKTLGEYDAEIFQMALGEKAEEGALTLTDSAYGSTLIARTPTKHGQLKIPVSTLDIELEERIAGKRTLLKTDCQGGDLAVVKGAENSLQHCDVVILEVSLYRFWGAHHPDFYDVIHHMKTKGFVVLDILDGLFKPSNDALAQVDLVFAKARGPLRPHHRW